MTLAKSFDFADTQKPSHEEWLYWTDVVIDRLSACVKIYAHPPFDVVLMEKDQQAKKAATLDLLHRVHHLIDSAETPTESLADVAHHDERMISGLAVLLREVLAFLPALSADMQKLLKSPWQHKFNGRQAELMFRGPQGKENEGIGSGQPANGHLPAILQSMLERERIGDSRQPREELHRTAKVTSVLAHAEPLRQAVAGQRRWADRNARSGWRSSGGIE